jgi:uncharacterized protein YjbI with pentapeptide repeats
VGCSPYRKTDQTQGGVQLNIWIPFVPIPYECDVGTLELREVHSPHSMESDDGVAYVTFIGVTSLVISDARLRSLSFNDTHVRSFEVVNSVFTDCDMTRFVCERTAMTDVKFWRCNLAKVGLHKATLERVTFSETDLTKANLSSSTFKGGCYFEDCVMEDATLSCADAERLVLRRTKFAHGSLHAMRVQELTLVKCDAAHANLSQIRADLVRFFECSLDAVNYCGVRVGRTRVDNSPFNRMSMSGSLTDMERYVNAMPIGSGYLCSALADTHSVTLWAGCRTFYSTAAEPLLALEEARQACTELFDEAIESYSSDARAQDLLDRRMAWIDFVEATLGRFYTQKEPTTEEVGV